MKNDLIVILGPTASGKTKLAIELAKKIDSEIISADSRQVYVGMDIGTGKDLNEYENNNINYHLIDILQAGDKYNVHSFQKDFKVAYDSICNTNKTPVLCGGTGLYVDAILRNYDLNASQFTEEKRNALESESLEYLLDLFNKQNNNENNNFDLSTKKRIVRALEKINYEQSEGQINHNYISNPIVFCLTLSTEIRQKRIKKRLDQRLKEGLVEEVQDLKRNGITSEQLRYYGLEYKFIDDFIENKLNFKEFYDQLYIAIRQYAKRQMTYFRGMERKGQKIYWLDAEEESSTNTEKIIQLINY